MKFDDPEKSLQFRSVSASNEPGAGGGDAAFHGHGVTGEETQQKRVRRFYEMVARDLPHRFPHRNAPLVLFGPESEIGHYRQANHYEHLLDDAIVHNPSSLSRDALEERVQEWIDAQSATRECSLLEDFAAARAQGQGSDSLAEISRAAVQGRVGTLFVRPGVQRFGTRDAATGELDVRGERKAGDEELVDAVATAAALSGAHVHFLRDPAEKAFSLDEPAAAIYRY